MRLRTFTAADMPSALAQVREALGDDAIILSSNTDRASKRVTVTAAVDPDAGEPTAKSPSPAAEAWLDELTMLLRYHNTPEALAGRLTYKARQVEMGRQMAFKKLAGSARPLEAKTLANFLSGNFKFEPLLDRRAAKIMLVGPAGIGKTLAIAKMAAQLCMEKAHLAVITTDTKRAGGIEQLEAFTDILKIPLTVAETPKELATTMEKANGAHVLIDTSGCNPYDKADMKELTGFIGVGGFEPVLTLPAGMDSMEAADTARAYAFPTLRRLLATRVDAARRFGSLLAAADARGLAFASQSASARVVGEIQPMTAAELARLLLQYRLQTA